MDKIPSFKELIQNNKDLLQIIRDLLKKWKKEKKWK